MSLLSQTLAAYGRAEAALAAQQAEALAALAAVGRQLAAHAQESGSEARRLAQHPSTLELVSSSVLPPGAVAHAAGGTCKKHMKSHDPISLNSHALVFAGNRAAAAVQHPG